MRTLIRRPLTWLVVAELVVFGALVAIAWTVVGSAARVSSGSAMLSVPAPATDSASPLPQIPGESGPGLHGPLPGLNLTGAFWQERLAELNRDQALFVQLEWRIVHAAMDALHRYLETVVLPAVRAAETSVP